MRRATLINQDWLRSKTMGYMDDATEIIAFRLLLISDDYGRFPDDPRALRIMMNDVRHDETTIRSAIDYLVDERTVERYVADEQAICAWVNWDRYQNIRWRDDAKYPDKDGLYEVSNNPQTIAKRVDKRSVQRVDKRSVQQSEKEKEKEKEKKKKAPPPAEYVSFINEILPDGKFTDAQMGKQCKALKTLINAYGQVEVFAVLRWGSNDVKAGNDFPGWKAVFNSVERLLRDGHQKYKNMRGQYKAASEIRPHHEYGK